MAINNIISSDIKKSIIDALWTLSYEHRLIILMRDFRKLSYEEIARSIGCTADDVGVRIQQARKALKHEFAKYC